MSIPAGPGRSLLVLLGADSSAVALPSGGPHNSIDATLVFGLRRGNLSESAEKEKRMSMAAVLGVEDIDGPLRSSARAAWPRWVAADSGLGVVLDLPDLPRWLKSAVPADRDVPMATLIALATDDADAAVTLAWLLVPRATHIAGKLAEANADIDCFVAGQLWIETRSGKPLNSDVAATSPAASRRLSWSKPRRPSPAGRPRP
ncbi:hypothetical protein ACQCX2_18400 [Propionibacteriaceae bacterium Y1700]|uniref:hypothetical protein n=1 Tax=Microlunatus sp. Y1700 TaxID=3418487 RepID=UPI003DA6CF97